MIVDPNFQTPIPVVKQMIKMIPKGTKTVLEPSPGIGNIVSHLSKFEVTAPDDFFLLDKSQRFDCVIMNPPFSERTTFLDNAPDEVKSGMRVGYHFLTECMEMSDNVIALMPWFTLIDSDLRMQTLKKYGLKSVTGLPRKTFNYARIQTCILQLKKGYRGGTTLRTFSF